MTKTFMMANKEAVYPDQQQQARYMHVVAIPQHEQVAPHSSATLRNHSDKPLFNPSTSFAARSYDRLHGHPWRH